MKKRYESPELDTKAWILSEAISVDPTLSLGKDQEVDGGDEEWG